MLKECKTKECQKQIAAVTKGNSMETRKTMHKMERKGLI
jgi:hypothetical protein